MSKPSPSRKNFPRDRTLHTVKNQAKLLIPGSLVFKLLRLYDIPDPRDPNRVIRGYDKAHARRTAIMCGALALALGHALERVKSYQIACLLHDLGRAGLDRPLFGAIWSWAKERGVPTRPREWRAVYPQTPYGRETEAFLKTFGGELQEAGITMDSWAKEQVEMRLGYARRLTRRLREVKPILNSLKVSWYSWMGHVMLYYYYPEKLERSPAWVRQLGEVLVACEQFEAFSNHQRGRDYYTRREESFLEAFAYLDKLTLEGILSVQVMTTLRDLAAQGMFDQVLAEARGKPLSKKDVKILRGEAQGVASWR